MRTLIVTFFALALFSATCYGTIISDTGVSFSFTNVTDPRNPSQLVPGFTLLIQQSLEDILGNETEVGFKFTHRTFPSTPATIQGALFEFDESCDVYVAQPGAFFSADTITAGQFTPVFIDSNLSFNPIVPIPLGNFYLGLNTGFLRTGQLRDVFGWIELYNDGFSLTEVANAMAYGESGITIGAPEPSFAAIPFFSPLLPLLTRRRPKIPVRFDI